MATTSTGDLKLLFGINAQGTLTVDFARTPNGDLALVTGLPKLVQEIIRWLLSPIGSNPLQPTWGNPLFGLLGQPSGGTDIMRAMVEQAEASFIALQASAAAQGFLALDEQVDHFENLHIALGGSPNPNGVHLPVGTAVISFTVVARSGASQNAFLPFSLTLSV
jgi:hypothetical protein